MNKAKANEIINIHSKALNGSNKKCNCDIPSAMYYCFGVIKCQYCNGLVNIGRAIDFIDFNTTTS